jgi:hypothetical protein
MSSLTNLDQLIAQLSPVLVPGEYVFVCVPTQAQADALEPICTFVEQEGITAICSRERADAADLAYEEVFRQVTLQVYSSLQAVGLVAAVAEVLRSAAIPCNVVSAFHHDHLFVPAVQAKQAQELLENLSHGAAAGTLPNE